MTTPTHQVRDARTEKRFFVDNVIIRGYGKALGVYGVAVYSTLCMHANLETQQGFPSHGKIADLLDCSIGKVKDSLKLLEELKLIHSQPRYDKETHRQTSNLYTLLTPPVPPVTADTPPGNAGMTTNNPPLDQSYLKEEPPLADSPVEDSLHVPLSRLPSQDPTFWAEGESPPEPSPQEAPEKHIARLRDEYGITPQENVAVPLEMAAVVAQNRAAVAHPDGGDASRDGDPWVDITVKEWARISGKDFKGMSIGTKLKLAGVFRKVGAIADSGAVPVAAAIGRFPGEHKWWAETVGFEWPSDTFCNKLGMMLVPDVQPDPPPVFTFVEPDWLGVST